MLGEHKYCMDIRGILLVHVWQDFAVDKTNFQLWQDYPKRGANSWNVLYDEACLQYLEAFVGAMDLCVRNAVSLENLTGPVEVAHVRAAGIRVRSRPEPFLTRLALR